MTQTHAPAAVPAAHSVSQAVRQASSRTGAEFGYLMRTAMRESSMNPQAQASSSSASGLFQFVDQTWLGVMKAHGAEHGLGKYADAIKTDARGRQYVPDAGQKREILALRKDPQVASLMAGALTADNRQTLETRLGRKVSDGELYAAHFLGASAASHLITKAEHSPSASAAAAFPAAARANRAIFYASSGQARSVAEVYDRLTGGHGDAGTTLATAVATAEARDRGGPSGGTRMADAVGAGYGGGGGLLSRQALVLSPRVVALLSSLDPIPDRFKAARANDSHTFDATA